MKRKIFSKVFALALVMFINGASAGIFPVSTDTPPILNCPLAPSHSADKSTFCGGFQSVVECNCMTKLHNQSECADTQQVFDLMWLKYAHFGSNWLYQACEGNAPGVQPQECEDQWSCFMFGLAGSSKFNVAPPSDGECFSQKTDVTPC